MWILWYGNNNDELLKQVKDHTVESHEITEFTPKAIELVKWKKTMNQKIIYDAQSVYKLILGTINFCKEPEK